MVVANGVVHQAVAETEAAVLVLPIGRSVLRRLAEAAAREGVDTNTLSLNLLLFALGARMGASQRPASTVSTANVSVVCLACGRGRQSAGEPRCSACGGGWTSTLR